MDLDQVQQQLEQTSDINTRDLQLGEDPRGEPQFSVENLSLEDDENDKTFELPADIDEPHEEYSEGLASDDEGNTEQDTPELEYKDDIPVSLFTSLRVYVMADKFIVPALKLVARKRFHLTMLAVFDRWPDTPVVVDELYRTTAPSDHVIREIPCRLIASQYKVGVPYFRPWEELMVKHGDFALGVLMYSHLYWSERKCKT